MNVRRGEGSVKQTLVLAVAAFCVLGLTACSDVNDVTGINSGTTSVASRWSSATPPVTTGQYKVAQPAPTPFVAQRRSAPISAASQHQAAQPAPTPFVAQRRPTPTPTTLPAP
jgi:hypothetical protein